MNSIGQTFYETRDFSIGEEYYLKSIQLNPKCS
jgi:hypothetical protein